MSEKKRTPTGDFLDVASFGALLDVGRDCVYKAIARGELQAVRIGGVIRLPREQLDTLLSEGERDARQSCRSASV